MLRGTLPRIGKGVRDDIAGRVPWYKDDYREASCWKLRVLAAATYTLFASAIPALAFGEQLYNTTGGALTQVQVLAATALTGVLQALAGGQPLLIVGVAEPIVLVYGYMFKFARKQEGLGEALFLEWAAWTCVWAALLVAALAAANACNYIRTFTRFAGELFGALIAVLFMQQAVKGAREEFLVEGLEPTWRLANGLWSLFLAFGLLLTSLLLRRGRSWRFWRKAVRGLLADYGVPLMVVAWSGLSFAVSGPDGFPTRVHTPDTWAGSPSWTTITRMGDVPGRWVAAALVPALIISVLFYFDHSVSSQLAQQPEFNPRKPSAYHWDLLLLSLMTLACGLLGLPPVNGVLPQSPLHSRALCQVDAAKKRRQKMHSGRGPGSVGPHHSSEAAAGDSEDGGAAPPPGAQAAPGEELGVIPVRVIEQRVSGLLQSLGVGVLLAITPAIRQIPTAVLWGFFAFMALESLPGSQFWDRLLLLLTDPKKRGAELEKGHAPYLELVPYRTIALFTLLQLTLLLLIYGLTWAGIAGILFPVPIMLLVPFRIYLMPRLFKTRHLQELDALPAEEAPPLPHGQAMAEAEATGLAPPDASAGGDEDEEDEVLERETARFQIKHHVSAEALARRASSELAQPPSPQLRRRRAAPDPASDTSADKV